MGRIGSSWVKYLWTNYSRVRMNVIQENWFKVFTKVFYVLVHRGTQKLREFYDL